MIENYIEEIVQKSYESLLKKLGLDNFYYQYSLSTSAYKKHILNTSYKKDIEKIITNSIVCVLLDNFPRYKEDYLIINTIKDKITEFSEEHD